MNITLQTASYFMKIYNYSMPKGFDWGKMVEKYRVEFSSDEFIKLAEEISAAGYTDLEIWEPLCSYTAYSEKDAAQMSSKLRQMGFENIAYCFGGWIPREVQEIEKTYRIAKALGAKVVTGCIWLSDAEVFLQEIERCGKLYDIRFAIQNHPAPNIGDPADVKRLTEGYTTIGANIDVNIYYDDGFDVLSVTKLLKDKLYHVILKDAIKDEKQQTATSTPIGDGGVPIAGFLALLKQLGYEGMVSLGYFAADKSPTPGLIKSLNYVKKQLA